MWKAWSYIRSGLVIIIINFISIASISIAVLGALQY